MDSKTAKDNKPGKKPTPGGGGMGGGNEPMGALGAFFAPRIRELKFDMHLLSKSATSIAGLILLSMLTVLAAFPWVFATPELGADPYFLPFDKYEPTPLPPMTDGFLLGSGVNGADIYYGIVWGARISMTFAIQVVFISLIIGTLLGIFSGYKGGLVDELIMRITDVFLSIPSLILVMAIAAVLGRDLNATKIALIMVWWSGYTRLVRGQVLSIKENSYIDAARASGSSEGKIMIKHIFPNSWAPLLVAATMDMGTVVLVMAGLSYLGLGAEHGMAEWGVMINDGQRWFVIGYWWTVFFPGMAILTFVMAFNLLGDGLRDIFDPKMRR
ncbi:MAG: ABC transporter permease [Thermoplasmata archaeon]